MVTKTYTQKKSSKNRLILFLIIVLCVVIGLIYIYMQGPEPSIVNETAEKGSIASNAEPTEEEMSAGDKQKQLNETREKIDNTTPATKQALPIITFAEQIDNTIEVGAFINGIYEDGGTCKLIATKDQLEYTKDVQSIKNAQSTDCQTFNIPAAELAPGIWEITVEYASPTASGKSDIRKITVY